MAGSLNLATASALSESSSSVNPAVESYASEFSVSLAEAVRRLDRIQPLQDVLAEIRELEHTRLAGWGIDHAGTFTGWVWLTGDQPPSPEAANIADTHTDIEIRTGAAHSLAELIAAQTRLFQDVPSPGRVTHSHESLAAIQRIVTFTDIDLSANAIQIGIDPGLVNTVSSMQPDPGRVAVTDEALQTKITEVTLHLQNHINVKYVVADGRDVSVFEDFKGGEPISSVEAGCTSGFAAQERDTGVYGIITAAHCTRNDTQSMIMHSVLLSPVERVHGPDVDAQFQSIPTGGSHRLFDDHLCEERDPCDVVDDVPRSKMKDAYVCHYGRKTRETCGIVESIFYAPSGDSCETTCNNSFIRAYGDGLKGCSGDSGGPWYYEGTAYGILSGGNGPDDCNSGGKHLYFSPIQAVERFLNVDILTEGFVEIP